MSAQPAEQLASLATRFHAKARAKYSDRDYDFRRVNSQINQPGLNYVETAQGLEARYHVGATDKPSRRLAAYKLALHEADLNHDNVPTRDGETHPVPGTNVVMPCLVINPAIAEAWVNKAYRPAAAAPTLPTEPEPTPTVLPTTFDWRGTVNAAIKRFENGKAQGYTLTRRAAELIHDLRRIANETDQ